MSIELTHMKRIPFSKRIDLDQLHNDLDSIQNHICILKTI